MPPSLRVVTANAASGRDSRGRHDVPGWAHAAATLGHAGGVDVWAVQEVDRRLPRSDRADQTAVLLQELGPGWVGRFAAAVHGQPGTEDLRPATAGDPDQASYGVALATHHPVLAWHELHLAPSTARLPLPLPPGAPPSGAQAAGSDAPADERAARPRLLWFPHEPRAAVAATLDLPGGPVTAVCTHLSFAPTRAVRQLREVVAWSRDLPGPTVLLGDLNLPRGVAAWASGLAAAPAGASYPASSPRVQLDHVLVGSGLELGVASTRRCGESDHLAVTAEVIVC